MFTDEEILCIYNEEYLNGYSTIKIGEKYDINPSLLRSKFLKLGLKLRSNKENSRKYHCDNTIFNMIDTIEKAYWIGFLSADGYISNCGGKKVGLALKDRSHIEKFKKFISATYPIKTYRASGFSESLYYRILISSDLLFEDLKSHGIIEHKSNLLKPPDTIAFDLMKYYILGYYDGDGSIFLNKGKYPFYSINIVGTDEICNYINNYLLKNNVISVPAKLEKRKQGQIVSYIRFGGNIKVKTILDFLYDGIDCSIPLDRKYLLYKKCINRIFD